MEDLPENHLRVTGTSSLTIVYYYYITEGNRFVERTGVLVIPFRV